MKSVCLIFALAVCTIRSEVVNLNELVDKNVFRIGEYIQQQEWIKEGVVLRDYHFSNKYSFLRGFMLGMDIPQRTGDCKLIKEGKNLTYELNLGSKFLVIVLPWIRYDGEEMSAVLRVKDNSFYFSINQFTNDGVCQVTVNDMAIKSLGQVEVLASNPKYKGADVEEIFENVRNILNNEMKLAGVYRDRVATEFWCKIISGYPKGLFDEL